MLSVIHRARSYVSRPRRYHLIFVSGGLSGKLFFAHLFCLAGWTWDLSWKYPLLFCFLSSRLLRVHDEPRIAGVWDIAWMRVLHIAWNYRIVRSAR